MQQVTYLLNHQVDKLKWDEAVNAAENGFIYCQSFYLDSMCNWDALVLGDYDFIMPLPHKNKMGFRYIYTPPFISQLGIVGRGELTSAIIELFIRSIPSAFTYIDLQMNEFNHLVAAEGMVVEKRKNYVLSLEKDYNTIANGYSKDAKKNLRQSLKHQLRVATGTSLPTVFDLYKKAYGNVNSRISDAAYDSFFKVCERALELQKGFVTGIVNDNNEIVAAGFFGIDSKRIYYLLGAPTPLGRTCNATHFLINEVIKAHAHTSLLFDFEGSDLPDVAYFYKKFNPEEKYYPHLIINRLPFWASWLKR